MQKIVCDQVVDEKTGSRCEGEDGVATLTFTLDNQPMRIDLCSAHLKALGASATRSAPPVSTSRARAKAAGLPMGAIKAWGREHGFEVKDRGRPAQALVDAWRNASAAT